MHKSRDSKERRSTGKGVSGVAKPTTKDKHEKPERPYVPPSKRRRSVTARNLV